MTEHHDTVKHTLDFLSAIAAIGSFLNLFTPVFGLVGAIWTSMRIVEMIVGKPFAEIIGTKKADDAERQ